MQKECEETDFFHCQNCFVIFIIMRKFNLKQSSTHTHDNTVVFVRDVPIIS